MKTNTAVLFCAACSLVSQQPVEAVSLLLAPDRVWMLSHEKGIRFTGERVELIDGESGTVSFVTKAATAAVALDRKSLLVGNPDREARVCELAEYDLSIWPPRLRLRSNQDAWVQQLAATGIQNMPYAADWMTMPGALKSGTTGGRSLLCESRGLDLDFQPIPVLSCITVDLLQAQSLVFCPTRPYTCAATAQLSDPAKDVLPKSTFIRHGNPWPDVVHMVVVVDGRKVWAYPVGDMTRPVAFSQDGKRLLAGFGFRYGQSPQWLVVDVDTGKLKKADWIPSGFGCVLAANGDLSAAIFRERFAVYLVTEKGAKKELARYPEPPEAARPPPPSATTQEYETWLRLTPAIAADFYNGTFFVYDGNALITVSPEGGDVNKIALKRKTGSE